MTLSAGGSVPVAVPVTRRRVTRIVVGVQGFVAACYFLGAGGLLAAAAVKNGGLTFAPFALDGAVTDPMTLMPDLGGVELLVYLPIFLVAVLGLPLGIASVAGGAALLPSAAAWRSHRRLMWTLAGTTALAAAYLVLSLTPFGESIQQWLLT